MWYTVIDKNTEIKNMKYLCWVGKIVGIWTGPENMNKV